jgi:hypothetical protein
VTEQAPQKHVKQGETLLNGAIINVSKRMSIENGLLFGLSLPNSSVPIRLTQS